MTRGRREPWSPTRLGRPTRSTARCRSRARRLPARCSRSAPPTVRLHGDRRRRQPGHGSSTVTVIYDDGFEARPAGWNTSGSAAWVMLSRQDGGLVWGVVVRLANTAASVACWTPRTSRTGGRDDDAGRRLHGAAVGVRADVLGQTFGSACASTGRGRPGRRRDVAHRCLRRPGSRSASWTPTGLLNGSFSTFNAYASGRAGLPWLRRRILRVDRS